MWLTSPKKWLLKVCYSFIKGFAEEENQCGITIEEVELPINTLSSEAHQQR